MKYIALLAFVVIATLGWASSASAHVLIMDEANKIGAIVHIVPDDDPVAGEESIIYFDASKLDMTDGSVVVSVEDSSGKKDSINAIVNNSLATAACTFSGQGLYRLSFNVTTKDESYLFRYSQRVSRGVSAGQQQNSDHPWAEPALIASSTGLAVLIVLIINRRKHIARHSSF